MATHQLIHRHQSRVPPGFRFHPTDEELVGYYLHKKVSSRRIDLDVIREIDLYKMEPWDLQEKCRIGSAEQTEWYFFSHKDKKYPTGTRTNRATTAGFWKATGRDKTIHTKYNFIGMRKTLVFYKGRAPNGQKTDWIMHEYRLEDEQQMTSSSNNNLNNDQDGWVVCRVFKKKINLKGQNNKADSSPGGLYDAEEATLMHQDNLTVVSNNTTNSKSYLPPLVPAPQSHVFSCKQEFSRLADFSSAGAASGAAYNDPFSRLPQLESPKFTSTTTSSMFSAPTTTATTTGFAARHCYDECGNSSSNKMNPIILRNNYPPPAFALEEQLMAEDEHLSIMSEWEQQAAALKDTMRYCVDNDDYAGDVALLLRLSKQEIDMSSSTADGELWNFKETTTT